MGVMTVVAKEFGFYTPSRSGCDKRGAIAVPYMTVYTTAMDHAFARPLHLLHLHVAGLHAGML